MNSIVKTKYFICDGNSETIFKKLDSERFMVFFNDELGYFNSVLTDLFSDYPNIKIIYLNKHNVNNVLKGKVTVNQFFKKNLINNKISYIFVV